MTTLLEDAGIWTIARAAQLFTSSDETVRTVFWVQLHSTIKRGLKIVATSDLPISE